MSNAVKADNKVYHKDCVPTNAVNILAIDVSEDDVCINCGRDFTELNLSEDADDQIDETRDDDEAKALAEKGKVDPNDLLRS